MADVDVATAVAGGAQPAPPGLSEEESAIYDRQLRIWGVEAQTRMRSSSILVLGMSGLSCEVVKNLVLTGIGSLTLHDTALTSLTDLSSNFFLAPSDVGHNRATASLPRLQPLNPNVRISAVTDPLASLPPTFFRSFSVIVLTELPLSTRIHLSRILHSLPVPPTPTPRPALFTADLHLYHGMLLLDLPPHSFTGLRPPTEVGGDPTPYSGTQVYVEYERVMGMGEEEVRGSFGRLRVERDGAQVAVEMMRRVRERGGERGAYVSAVCAIFGGLVAQEVLKVLSGKEEPHQNCVLLNAEKSTAIVKHLRPTEKATG